jgi:Amt family ammonium transporter
MLNQVMTGTVIGSLLWYLFGFGLVFGTSRGGIIGNPFQHFMLMDVPIDDCFPGQSIPALLYCAFQMMFALMTPLILTGAWAERMRFRAFLIFVIVWPFLVYYPLAHWIWNADGFLAKMGILDFAGGLVIHASSGIGALVVSLYLDKRKVTKSVADGRAHNLTLTLIGTVLIWAGWYSFNGGSALKANDQSSYALVNTHISACVSSMVWLVISFF